MRPLVPAPLSGRKSLMERVEDALLPLINLVFLLLMFFILAGQMQNRTLPDLPGTVAEDAGHGTEADLVIRASGDWQVAGQTIAPETLARHLPAATANPSLKIGAAAGTPMPEIETLLGLLAAEGYRDVVLLTEPSGR